MAFRMQNNSDTMLMRQMVSHEQSAKRNFDYFTGQNPQAQFYQGRLDSIVKNNDPTYTKDQSANKPARIGYSPEMMTPGPPTRICLSPPPEQHEFTPKNKNLVVPDRFRSDKQMQMTDPAEKFKKVTVHGRLNKHIEPMTDFKVDKYPNVFNGDRFSSMTAYDAMIDPHQTMSPPARKKDAGYHELGKRNTQAHDSRNKVIADYAGNLIIKIDSLHGQKNGNLYGQTTHANLKGADRPNQRQTFGMDSQYDKDSPFLPPIMSPSRIQNIGEEDNKVSPTKGSKFNPFSTPIKHQAQTMPNSPRRTGEDSLSPSPQKEEKVYLNHKLNLMRKMVRNEKRANEILNNQLNKVIHSVHSKDKVAILVELQMRADGSNTIGRHM